MAADITFHLADIDNHPFNANEKKYAAWLEKVATSENKSIASITYVFCTDEYLLDINIRYLGHDYYTDIITFPYQEGMNIKSDMFISLERVKENAAEFNVSFENELKRVMVHGLLHLMGYGDKTVSDAEKMRSKEDEYLLFFDEAFSF
jgi:probable rRNA maturation factor